MTVSASEIRAGKCYVTGITSQLRRVVEVGEFELRYVVLGEGSSEPAELSWVAETREKFAAEVDREVACPEE